MLSGLLSSRKPLEGTYIDYLRSMISPINLPTIPVPLSNIIQYYGNRKATCMDEARPNKILFNVRKLLISPWDFYNFQRLTPPKSPILQKKNRHTYTHQYIVASYPFYK